MPTANSIITPQAVKSANAVCTAAKTTYNDSTNAVKILTAGASGSVLYGLKAVPRATVTATQLQLYRSPDNGVTLYLIGSALMAAYTMAQTTAAPVTDFGYTEGQPLRLGSIDTLWVAIGVALAGGVSFDAQYEDL
jgi:peptidase E